jgi:hypothetical protein
VRSAPHDRPGRVRHVEDNVGPPGRVVAAAVQVLARQVTAQRLSWADVKVDDAIRVIAQWLSTSRRPSASPMP